MKNITILLLIFCCHFMTYSQNSKIFETDYLKFVVTSDCNILPYEGQFHKEAATDGIVSNLSVDWIGMGISGNLKYATNSEYDNVDNRYKPGFQLDEDVRVDMDEVFSVSGLEILEHIADHKDNGIIDNPITSIYSWPARGNEHFEDYYPGVDLTDVSKTYPLASFRDVNLNGLYEPDMGDFPMYELYVYFEPSVLPQQMFYTSIYLDEAEVSKLGSVIGMTTYNIQCGNNETADHTFFTEYQKSNTSHYDIGCNGFSSKISLADENTYLSTSLDDGAVILKGSDDDEYTVYIQRQVLSDVYAAIEGRECNNIVDLVLRKVTFDNVIATSSDPMSGKYLGPDSDKQSYFDVLVAGDWPDGTPLTYGYDGYNPNDTSKVYHLFQGELGVPDSWNESSEQVLENQKNAVFASTYSQSFQSQAYPTRNIRAHTFMPKTTNDQVYVDIDALDVFFYNYVFFSERWMFENLCDMTLKADDSKITAYPNPVSEKLMLNKIVEKLDVYDSLGRKCHTQNNTNILDMSGFPIGIYYINIVNEEDSEVLKVLKVE